jgi:hypothetical protein
MNQPKRRFPKPYAVMIEGCRTVPGVVSPWGCGSIVLEACGPVKFL